MKTFVIVAISLMLTACAAGSGFNREALRTELQPQRDVTDRDIKGILATKAQLPRPFKLGVYLASNCPSRRAYLGSRAWTTQDKEHVLAAFSDLKTKGVVSDVYLIPESIVEGKGRKAIRLAAARTGADAVLIINGIADVDQYNTDWGPLYCLLVTYFFVPGSQADGLYMADTTLWDVGNDYLYLGAEAEGTSQQIAPGYFIDEKALITKAKLTALDSLGTDVAGRLSQMAASTPQPASNPAP